jgi:RNA polymerase sigma factor (sigma-70 family)
MTVASRMPRLLAAAAAGEPQAWESLVTAFSPMVRAVGRRYRLSDVDQDEIAQTTWLALVEHIADIRDPAALPGWLSSTARNEAIRLLRQGARVQPCETVEALAESATEEVAETLESQERRDAVRRAIDRAPATHRSLLTALATEPARTYTELSVELKMPVGSIGPTRARCLGRLRRDPAVARLMDEFAPPARETRPARPDLDLT